MHVHTHWKSGLELWKCIDSEYGGMRGRRDAPGAPWRLRSAQIHAYMVVQHIIGLIIEEDEVIMQYAHAIIIPI
jgi:hypothetical protein